MDTHRSGSRRNLFVLDHRIRPVLDQVVPASEVLGDGGRVIRLEHELAVITVLLLLDKLLVIDGTMIVVNLVQSAACRRVPVRLVRLLLLH